MNVAEFAVVVEFSAHLKEKSMIGDWLFVICHL